MLKLILPIISLTFLNSWPWATHTMIALSLISLFMIPQHTFFSPSPHISLDYLNIPLITLTLWLTALMILASFKSIKPLMSNPQFLKTNIILTTLLIMSFSFNNFIIFYIIFESSLIPTLILIIMWGYQPERLQAGMYMMIYTITASLPLLLTLLFISTNTLSLNMFSMYLPYLPSHPKLIWLALMMAFMVKMPLYTLHLWLPKAHVEAPVAGSMILAGILLKLGSYGLIRMTSMNPPINLSMTNLVIALTLLGSLNTSMICLRHPDLKALIAYASVAHMCLLTASVMTNSLWGWEGALTMMLAHGIASSALFASANTTYESTSTRNLFLTKGMLSLFPAMTLWWFLLLTANLSGPPSMNLMSEILLMTSIISFSFTSALPIVLSSFLTAAYSLILFTSTQHGHYSLFSNPSSPTPHVNHLLLSLHAIPVFLLITKTASISMWCS